MSMTTALTQDQINALRLLHDTGVLSIDGVQIASTTPGVAEVMTGVEVYGDGRYRRPSPHGMVDVTEEINNFLDKYGTPTTVIRHEYMAQVAEALS